MPPEIVVLGDRALLGYMPQAFSLYPDLTVMENLKFFADINGVSAQKQKTRIAELLEFARLTEFTTRRSENLSGGMRKKLALACALIHDPKILLLDEPTTGVDPVSRRELWRPLSKVIQQGVTVLVSTPYMDEAERCNTVSIINRGRVLISGAPAELEAQLPFRIVEVKAKPRRALRANTWLRGLCRVFLAIGFLPGCIKKISPPCASDPGCGFTVSAPCGSSYGCAMLATRLAPRREIERLCLGTQGKEALHLGRRTSPGGSE